MSSPAALCRDSSSLNLNPNHQLPTVLAASRREYQPVKILVGTILSQWQAKLSVPYIPRNRQLGHEALDHAAIEHKKKHMCSNHWQRNIEQELLGCRLLWTLHQSYSDREDKKDLTSRNETRPDFSLVGRMGPSGHLSLDSMLRRSPVRGGCPWITNRRKETHVRSQ